MKDYMILLAVVLCIFGGIVLFTVFLGNQFGKGVEVAALIAAAVILIFLYIKSKRS